MFLSKVLKVSSTAALFAVLGSGFVAAPAEAAIPRVTPPKNQCAKLKNEVVRARLKKDSDSRKLRKIKSELVLLNRNYFYYLGEATKGHNPKLNNPRAEAWRKRAAIKQKQYDAADKALTASTYKLVTAVYNIKKANC